MKKRIFSRFLPAVVAHAHCDIPCGIYDPIPAKIAAKTVQKMVNQLEELASPADVNDRHAALHYANAVGRRIAVKEEHARLCKQELYVLWSDFFKQEHLAKFPDLHEKFWKAVKLCSVNKQEVSKEHAQELVDAVDDIAAMFYEVKGDVKRYEAYKEATDKLF